MAKTRPGSSKKGRSKKSHKKNNTQPDGASSRPSKSPKALVQDAEAAMTQGDVRIALAAAQRAQKALEDASSGNGSNNIVLDGVGLAAVHALVGEIHLENGDVEDARAALDRSVSLDPEGTLPEALGGGVDKFLYMAQLSEEGGRDSIRWFERGAGALRTLAGRIQKKTGRSDSDDREPNELQDELGNLNAKLAQILCAMAEVWMTDLSFEDDCEQQCEALTTEATLVDPTSAEVWQTLANVRISQSRDEEARVALQRSLELWENLHPAHPLVPAFSVRVSLARMLMTVGWLTKAIEVTSNLLREDEQSVEVWYLAGYANYLLGQQLKEADVADTTGQQKKDLWKGAWIEARRCLGRCLRRFQQQQYEDERLGEHAAELFRELEAAVGPATQKEKDEEDYAEEDEDEEWEDDEEDDVEDDEDEDEDEEMED
ncbi:TPR domain protein [Sporothrix schenckii 1099-18]|uniref:TPR domain-containing protein n=2 Tax=Sporothrix schenckii TaxID=29908 RepID=U7Q053_SPOS1|nr:TPR domain protein [Sporothrix schenckii 1099-18]ERT01284.1 hypothetical protein HMPREF1624_02526 [Sporothrix schenckii ATCC 58251]KJR88451.1 TPR domain protein [Sporothrix schenckii 1099-18]